MAITLHLKSAKHFPLTAVKIENYGLTKEYRAIINFISSDFYDGTMFLSHLAHLQWQANNQQHYLHGFIEQFEYQGQQGNLYKYQLTLQSPLGRLHYRQSNRVFVDQSSAEILKEVLQQAGWIGQVHFSIKLQRSYASLPLMVQYNETDASFLHRIISQTKWHYHFLQKENAAELLIYDESELFNKVALPFSAASQQLPNQPSIVNIALKKDQEQLLYLAKTDACFLQLDQIIELYDHPQAHFNQCYRILNIDYYFTEQMWQAHLCLLPITTQYEPAPRLTKSAPLYLTAHIESFNGEPVHLDDKGYYRVRFGFDSITASGLFASAALPFLQPFLGSDCGQHFPLPVDTEVAVSFINGDWQRPYILNALPNAGMLSPVTNKNARQHIVRTAAGNTLLFADDLDKHIFLYTARKSNSLRLQIEPQTQSTLTTEQGEINIYAGKNIQIYSGGKQQIKCQARQIRVMDNHSLESCGAGIAIQSASNMQWYAKQDLIMTTKIAPIEFISAKNFNFHAEKNYQHDCGDLAIQVQHENATFFAKTMHWQSQDIYLGNSRAHILMKDGIVQFCGQSIILEAPTITCYLKEN